MFLYENHYSTIPAVLVHVKIFTFTGFFELLGFFIVCNPLSKAYDVESFIRTFAIMSFAAVIESDLRDLAAEVKKKGLYSSNTNNS